ncbi:disease resistance protein RPM1-like [Ricinus communis]|nr:disease resistance protein RPM1-like [Ricinus communis]
MVVDDLIGITVSALQNEALLLEGVHDELKELRSELESIRTFLVDAERKQLKLEGEKTWVASVRDLAYQVEDIIDEFMYNMHQQHTGGCFSQFLHQMMSTPKNLWVMRRIGSKLQKINETIKAMPQRRQRYDINYIKGAVQMMITNGLYTTGIHLYSSKKIL